MKKMIASLLALAMMLALCPPAFAAYWFLPDGVPMYEPACVMELDFGTLTILQAGFTKQVQCGFSPDRKDDSYEVNKRYYYNAKDGFALFAVKGILHNDSDSSIELGPLQPKVSYGPGDEQWAGLYGYTNVPVGSPEERSLEPAHDVEIVYATQVPGAMYFGNTDLLMELGGSQLGFLREDLKCYERIGFNAGDGEPAGDITMMTVDEQKPAEPKQADGTEADFFTFSDPKIVPAKKDGMYVLDFKFTCLYPEQAGTTYPTMFNLKYALLDEEYLAVKSGYLQVQYVFFGEKVRASGCELFEAQNRLISREELAEIRYVRFTGCEVTTPIEGTYNVHIKEYTFKARQEFPLFDTETVDEHQSGQTTVQTLMDALPSYDPAEAAAAGPILADAEALAGEGRFAEAAALLRQLPDDKDATSLRRNYAVNAVKDYVKAEGEPFALEFEEYREQDLFRGYPYALVFPYNETQKILIAVNDDDALIFGIANEGGERSSSGSFNYYLCGMLWWKIDPERDTVLYQTAQLILLAGAYSLEAGTGSFDIADFTTESAWHPAEIRKSNRTLQGVSSSSDNVPLSDAPSVSSTLRVSQERMVPVIREKLAEIGVTFADLGFASL